MNGDSYSRESGRHSSAREHHSSRVDRVERDDRRERDRGDRGERERDRRRRSRSPGHRGSRRDYEVDTYSSSRGYREREREDRYAGRERRDDHGWERDRERGSRRERRDDDKPRRDRDLFDDRGGRGRRERDGAGGRERKRSATPPPKKREPTPDLTNVVSILERKRRMTQWDIKPPGYEQVTAEQAKLSGMFPLPGAPRQQPMDPSRLQAFMNQPAGAANSSALKPTNSRQAKRLVVHNIPSNATDESLLEFFNLQMNSLNVVSGPEPCVSAQMSPDKSFALLEFKTAEDATVALAMDGITMENSESTAENGATKGLSIRRPKDYIVPAVADDPDYQEGVVSNVVKDSPNKISITSIPPYLTDENITDLLTAFGTLKAFVLVKDRDSEQNRGIAFAEYTDPAATDVAIESLNGMELGEGTLKAQRASTGIQQAAGLEMGVNAMSLLAGTTSADLEQGRVLQLLNMVTPDELIDNQEYEEIMDDVREECEKYGKVLEVKIPRPSGASRQAPGVGKIFVKYSTPEEAQKALRGLAGRKFSDRTVVATFFAEEYFDVNAW